MIPLHTPYVGDEECIAAGKVIQSGWMTQGPKVAEFEKIFADYVGAKYACATSSATTALHMALLALGIGKGDKVATVSHTYIATVNAIKYCGAEPVFIDVALKDYTIDPTLLELRLRTGDISAIIIVHQMGMPCDLESIIKIAKKYNLPVIEDAACATGSKVKVNGSWDKIGKPHGDIACFSFHPRKLITTGEGGMITTNNKKYDSLFRQLRQHGITVNDLERHGAKDIIVEEYPILGYNYRMSDVHASIGIEQMKKIDFIVEYRREVADMYKKYLYGIHWLKPAYEAPYAKTNWQSYPIFISKEKDRDSIIKHLLDKGIATRLGIMNAHQEKLYRYIKTDLPNSEISRNQTMLLPIFIGVKKHIPYITSVLHEL